MSVKIRLSRVGKKNQPYYRIVAKETRSKRDGRALDILGTYNPNLKPPVLKLDQKKYNEWIKKGGLPSEGLRRLLK